MDNRYVLSVSSHGEAVKGIMKFDYSDEASKLIVEMIIKDFNCNFLLSGKVTISILDLQAKDSSIQSVPLLSLNVQKSTIRSIDAESTGNIYVVLDLDVLADEVTEGNTEWKPAPEDVISAPFATDANEVEWQTDEPRKDVEIATPVFRPRLRIDRAITEPEAPVIDGKPVKGDTIIYMEKAITYEGRVIGVYKNDVYVVKFLGEE